MFDVRFSADIRDSINAPIAAIPCVKRIDVRDAFVAPIGDVNCTVGADTAIDGAEKIVVGFQNFTAELRFERRAMVLQRGPVNRCVERMAGDVCAVELGWERAAVVNNAAGREMMAAIAVVLNVFEITVGMRIVKRAVFTEVFCVIGALQCMQHLLAGVCAAKNFAVVVEVQSPQVAAAFGKEFKLMRHGLIAPDTLLKFDAANVCGNRAALHAVKPAARSPGERVGKRMGVFHSETGEQNFGVTVDNVVAIFVGIEKQVRGLHHENATASDRETGAEI
jgi:hypothetical protein